jgi:hypothetical protein
MNKKLWYAAHEWSENEGVIVIHFYAETLLDAILKAEYQFRKAYNLPDLDFNSLEGGVLTIDEVNIYE